MLSTLSYSVRNNQELRKEARLERQRLEQEIEKRSTKDTDNELEEQAMERHLKELDRWTVDRIDKRFSGYVSSDQMEKIRSQPAHFLYHREYYEHLRECGVKPEKGKTIVGDASEHEVYVDREHVLVPKTLVHERLHQFSSKGYKGLMGEKLYEGTTEYLARDAVGDPHLVDVGEGYPRETRLIETLSARVGDDAIKKAYFQGDIRDLTTRVDRDLGDGAMARIANLAKQGRLEEAEALVRKPIIG